MVRHWIKIILLSLIVLIQTACPKYRTTQNEDLRFNSSDQHSGGD